MNRNVFDRQTLAPTFPVAKFLGITFSQPTPVLVVAEFRSAPHHSNPMGTLHGGILCDLADAAMGAAFATALGPDESLTRSS
jgi:uncharacterized protein (TIGR00369 family)